MKTHITYYHLIEKNIANYTYRSFADFINIVYYNTVNTI